MRWMTLPLLLLICTPFSFSQNSSWTAHWLGNVTRTQSRQPHWITPVVLVTPRLEQEFRADFVRQLQPNHAHAWNLDNGKGLEVIPQSHIELLANLPPYLIHNPNGAATGFGDVSFAMKYRIVSANEQKGNYILTAFFGGSVPTGSHKNGAASAILTPTLSAGKGWGRFDIESSLGGTLPVDSTVKVGRSIVWNTVAQQHLGRYLWPELETNAIFYKGGANDGNAQLFLTPGLVAGRIPLHNRIGLTMGAGMQIAATHFHTYNHALILTARIPF
jgi:hypothetical protein